MQLFLKGAMCLSTGLAKKTLQGTTETIIITGMHEIGSNQAGLVLKWYMASGFEFSDTFSNECLFL